MENSSAVPDGQRAGRDRKGKSNKGTLKQRGELAEMAFTYKAAGLGFAVAKPYGDSESYDFILDSGVRLWRVQVKSTYGPRAHAYCVNAFSSSGAGEKKAYTAKQIDILVAFLVAENAWYVVPVKAFAPRKHLNFYPSGSKTGGRYEQYREAWDLMRPKTRRRTKERSVAAEGLVKLSQPPSGF
jgi:hypothetical protein